MVGTIDETNFDTTVASNRISVQDKLSKNVVSHYFAMETEVQGIGIEQILKKMYTAEFNDNGTSRAAENITKISAEDRQFLDLMRRKCSKEGNDYKLPLLLWDPDAYYKLPLPLWDPYCLTTEACWTGTKESQEKVY